MRFQKTRILPHLRAQSSNRGKMTRTGKRTMTRRRGPRPAGTNGVSKAAGFCLGWLAAADVTALSRVPGFPKEFKIMKRIILLGVVALAAARCPAIEFGYTEPNRVALVAFPETGVIAEISVREGARVREGQVMARLNCETLVQDQRIAEEQERLQKLRYEQIKGLYEAGNVSKEEHERARSDLAIATLRVQRILAQIADRTLRAPFDGIVTRINREVAESVSGAQTEVMTVVQLDSLRVSLNLPVQVAAGLVEGGLTSLVLDRRERVPAQVEFVSPVIDAASRTIRVTFLIANAGGAHRSGVHCTLVGEGTGEEEPPLPGRRARAGM